MILSEVSATWLFWFQSRLFQLSRTYEILNKPCSVCSAVRIYLSGNHFRVWPSLHGRGETRRADSMLQIISLLVLLSTQGTACCCFNRSADICIMHIRALKWAGVRIVWEELNTDSLLITLSITSIQCHKFIYSSSYETGVVLIGFCRFMMKLVLILWWFHSYRGYNSRRRSVMMKKIDRYWKIKDKKTFSATPHPICSTLISALVKVCLSAVEP